MEPYRVAFLVGTDSSFARSVLQGIGWFLKSRPDWLVKNILPTDDHTRALRQWKPDGIIARIVDQTVHRRIAAIGVPTVNVSGIMGEAPMHRVTGDNVLIGNLAANHFIERGYRNFAYYSRADTLYSAQRKLGYSQQLSRQGFTCHVYDPDTWRFNASALNWHQFDRRLLDWLRQLPKPAALFVPADFIALEVTEIAHGQVKIPEEAALLSVDNDTLLCELANPPISSIRLPNEQIGYQAAVLLEKLMKGKLVRHRDIILPPGEVVTRHSTDIYAIPDPDITAALRFIRDNTGRPITVGDVLREVPVSRRHLERMFKLHLRRTPLQEIRRQHIERAKRLLTDTDLPMRQLAVKAGFSHCAVLSAIFRRETGLRPTEYRRKYRRLA